jgi:hypothetical protein
MTMTGCAVTREMDDVAHRARRLRWWAALALAVCIAPMSHTRADLPATPAFDGARGQSAEELLFRAGNALGGADKLRAVDRLHIATSEWRAQRPEAALARTFKLWLPDRFQSHVAGFVTHTLNGRHLAFDRVVPPGVQQNAEQAVPATFRRVALAFLLRASDLSPPSLEGEATIAGLSGTLVGFTAPDGRSLKLLLAPTSAHPLALVYSTRIMGSNEPGPDQVWRLEDYRIVDGVRFPFKLTVVDATNELITEVREIQVNPAFTPADFPK